MGLREGSANPTRSCRAVVQTTQLSPGDYVGMTVTGYCTVDGLRGPKGTHTDGYCRRSDRLDYCFVSEQRDSGVCTVASPPSSE